MKTVRIVIYVEGGIVQSVLADQQGVSVMIVDYDNEKAGDRKEDRAFEAVAVDRKYVEATVQGKED
jgi:hypothetical protein